MTTFDKEEAKKAWNAARDAFMFRRDADAGIVMPAIGNLYKAIAHIEKLTSENEQLRNRVLEPLSEGQVNAALHAGRVERRIAEGDNAWTSLTADRDSLALECERWERSHVAIEADRDRLAAEVVTLRAFAVRIAESATHCRGCVECGDGPCCDECGSEAACDALPAALAAKEQG